MISLFARAERTAKRDRLGDPLQVLDEHIDFAALARAVDAKLVIGDRGRGGGPPYPTELMIRLLLLQQLYNLSDEALEYQVLDRLSFQRFAGLEHSGRVPDSARTGSARTGSELVSYPRERRRTTIEPDPGRRSRARRSMVSIAPSETRRPELLDRIHASVRPTRSME